MRAKLLAINSCGNLTSTVSSFFTKNPDILCRPAKNQKLWSCCPTSAQIRACTLARPQVCPLKYLQALEITKACKASSHTQACYCRTSQFQVSAHRMATASGVTEKKLAIITGVARRMGIGWALVKAFLREGYQVVGVDIKELESHSSGQDSLEPDRAALESFHFCQADISKPEEARRLIEMAVERFGHQIHVVVNNAGRSHPFLEPSSDLLAEFDAFLSANLSSAYYVSTCAIPYMPRGTSSIVHISSTRARMSEPDCEGYAAAKAGLCGLTHAQAVSLAGRVRVNAILPGWIVTDSVTEESLTEADHSWHPAGRVGVPRDVAELCVFLCDEQRAGFISGQEFVVDGGVTKKMVYPD